jgi:hypothetical protein
MGDIVQLLDDMTDVEDAEDYYGSAQVSKPPLDVRIVLTLALQRYMKVAIKAANLDLTRTYKNCQDKPEMATACRLVCTHLPRTHLLC